MLVAGRQLSAPGGVWFIRLETADAGTPLWRLREYLHTLYQFSGPWLVADDKFRATFGDRATPLTDALATTLAWFRDRAAVPAQH